MPTSNNKGIVTIRDVRGTAVVIEQLSKQVSAEANTHNNRGAVFSMWFVPGWYKQDSLKQRVNCCQKNLGSPLRWQSKVMARNELNCEKKILYVCCNDSETVINPLPGYDY
jgi:hypothetical protein